MSPIFMVGTAILDTPRLFVQEQCHAFMDLASELYRPLLRKKEIERTYVR